MKIQRSIDKTIIGMLITGFAGICVLGWLSTRPSRQLWAAYSPELVRKSWSKFDGQYVPITGNGSLYQQVSERVQQAANGDKAILSRVESITSIVQSFLAGYSESSFDTYWNFVAPTGRFEPKAEKMAGIETLIKQANEQLAMGWG